MNKKNSSKLRIVSFYIPLVQIKDKKHKQELLNLLLFYLFHLFTIKK